MRFEQQHAGEEFWRNSRLKCITLDALEVFISLSEMKSFILGPLGRAGALRFLCDW